MACVNMYRISNIRKFLLSSNFEMLRSNTGNLRNISSNVKVAKPGKSRAILYGILAGVGLGAGYSFYKLKQIPRMQTPILNPGIGYQSKVLDKFPEVEVSKEILYPTDSSGLEITLFQYSTCPFCCKVRAFLDFNGLSYNIVEVNPVLRQQLKWSDYKKVPILLIKVEDGYLQLNDSTMIISALTSYLHEKDIGLRQVANYYPIINYIDDDGSSKSEILNRYFLMYQGNLPDEATKDTISNERKWRKWVDDDLVHMLSPNVYRSTSEALESFNWFSHAGDWEHHFSLWERYLVIYVGAFAMWIIGKRLKRKYQLKDDVRQSLYDCCNIWLKELKKRESKFHGGSKPDLADLAVYGVLNSIEGCSAFVDIVQNTKMANWYQSVKSQINSHNDSLISINA